MPQEKIEDVSTEKLLKRKKFFQFISRVHLGVLIVFTTLIVADLIKSEGTERSTLLGGFVTLSTVWIHFFIINRINTELKRRKDTAG